MSCGEASPRGGHGDNSTLVVLKKHADDLSVPSGTKMRWLVDKGDGFFDSKTGESGEFGCTSSRNWCSIQRGFTPGGPEGRSIPTGTYVLLRIYVHIFSSQITRKGNLEGTDFCNRWTLLSRAVCVVWQQLLLPWARIGTRMCNWVPQSFRSPSVSTTFWSDRCSSIALWYTPFHTGFQVVSMGEHMGIKTAAEVRTPPSIVESTC